MEILLTFELIQLSDLSGLKWPSITVPGIVTASNCFLNNMSRRIYQLLKPNQKSLREFSLVPSSHIFFIIQLSHVHQCIIYVCGSAAKSVNNAD